MTHREEPLRLSIEKAEAVVTALAPHEEALREDAARSDVTGAIGEQTLDIVRAAGGYRLSERAQMGASGLVRFGMGLASLHPAAAWNAVVSQTNSLLAQTFAALSGFALPEDPDVQWCGVFSSGETSARRSESDANTHLVTGTWRYASNSDLAEWALLNIAHPEFGPAFIAVRRDELQLGSSWNALGLRATGSHTLTASELAVPDSHLLPASVLFADAPDAHFGLRLPSRLRTALGLSSVMVGAAEAMTRELVGSIKVSSEHQQAAGMPGRGLDKPGVSLAIGDTVSRVEAAKAVLCSVADGLDVTVSDGSPLPAAQLTGARMMLSRVTEDIAQAAHEVSLIAGSRACLEGDAVGRLWRDTHMTARHAALAPAMGFDLGAKGLVGPGEGDVAAAVGPLAPGVARR